RRRGAGDPFKKTGLVAAREVKRLRLYERVLALDAVALVEHRLADVVEQPVEVHVGVAHHPRELEDDFDPGEIHAEVARQRQNHFELPDLVFTIKTSVARRARRFDETFALVQPERLRMNGVTLR